MQKLIAEELIWVQAAKNAVSDVYLTYLRLLQSPDENIRAHAAHTLSCCQSYASEVVPVMKQHLAVEETILVRASLLLGLGLLMQKNGEIASFFTRALQEAEEPLVQTAAAMGCALVMKEQTSQEVLKVLLLSYELPSIVKAQFDELPFAETDLDACLSSSLRSIGLSISSLVVPTLIRAVRHSNCWNGLTLVPNLLYFVLQGQKIRRGMTVADLSDLQWDALTVIYETDNLWTCGNMAHTIGNFFDPQFADSHYSIWGWNDVGAFLSGENVFRDERSGYDAGEGSDNPIASFVQIVLETSYYSPALIARTQWSM